MSLFELAERCEQATGPDRQLNIAIAKAVGRYGSVVLGSTSVNFTASLDAAMTLVPEGHIVFVANSGVEARVADFSSCSAIVGPAEDTESDYCSGATMALALCAAALKARAASVDTLPKGRDAKQGSVRSKGSAVVATGDETPND